MFPEELNGTIVFASVAEDASGIHLRVQVNNGDFKVCFVPKEVWGEIKSGKDPKKELEIVADLLNGYKRDALGNLQQIENFSQRSVKILIE